MFCCTVNDRLECFKSIICKLYISAMMIIRYLCCSAFTVRDQSVFIFSILDVILRHPVIRILHSLSSDSCHFSHGLEVNLQPPIPIVSSRGPTSSETAVTPSVEPSVPRSVVDVVIRRGSHDLVRNTAVLETKWHVTTICLTRTNMQSILRYLIFPAFLIEPNRTFDQ